MDDKSGFSESDTMAGFIGIRFEGDFEEDWQCFASGKISCDVERFDRVGASFEDD